MVLPSTSLIIKSTSLEDMSMFDDGERFAFFQLAALEMMERVGFIFRYRPLPRYHTAMIPFLLGKNTVSSSLQWNSSVLTIHNLEFQGQFGPGDVMGFVWSWIWALWGWHSSVERLLKLDEGWDPLLLIVWQFHQVIVMKSEQLNIVCGLDQILRMESGKLTGIVNGIDTDSTILKQTRSWYLSFQ